MKITLEVKTVAQLDVLLSQIESLFTSAHTDTWGKPRGAEIADTAARVALTGMCECPADVLRILPIYRQLASHWKQVGTRAGMSTDTSFQQKAVARLVARKEAA